MKSQKIRKCSMRGLALLLLSLLLPMASCVNEHWPDEPGKLPALPEGKVRVGLHASSGDYQKPATRAANETSVYGVGRMPWVFVFDQPSGTYMESAQADLEDEQLYVILTAYDSPVIVVVLANVPPLFSDGTNTYSFDADGIAAFFAANGNKFEALEAHFQMMPLTATDALPYNDGYLFMGGLTALPGISATTSIGSSGSELSLGRLVAKVTVESTDNNFDFQNWTVVNVSNVQYLASLDSGSTISYEADLAEPNDAFYVHYTNHARNPAVIVKGEYKGTSYWYKLRFHISGNYVDVMPNNWYKFRIASVDGPGYASFAEAASETAPYSNHLYADVEVTDLSSHDLIDNGRYYLGVSNSEFIVFNDQVNQDAIHAVTVTTNAPASVSMRDILVTGQGLALTTPDQKIAVTGGEATTNIGINLTAAFTSGTITIKLGNLQKTIRVTRKPALSYAASATEFATGYAAGKIENQGDGGDGWLSLSLDGVTPAPGNEVTRPDGAGSIFLMATRNFAASGTTARTGGIAYLYRHNDGGRVKLYVAQGFLNTGSIDNGGMITTNAYIGAFWRWNETGERVIRIGDPYDSALNGDWTATVIEGEEWIKLAAGGSPDPYIYKATPGDAELYQVGGNATSVCGTYTNAPSLIPILFRIGLKSVWPSGSPADEDDAGAPRYGLVLLSYGTPVKYHKIYVRQGERADYVMKEGEPNGSGFAVDEGRSNARKFSPYNLSSPTTMDTQVDVNGGEFVSYPSQAGAFFQWANLTNQRFAYHPTVPAGPVNGWNAGYPSAYWNALGGTHETCPTGYRRPNDGSTSAANTAGSVAGSEMRQSLWLNPQAGFTSNLDNSVWGYYADGFFDRRVIGQSVGNSSQPNSAVSSSGTDAAYIGALFFNPNSNASLFLPAAGNRNVSGGTLGTAGNYCSYWTSSAYSDRNGWNLQRNRASGYMNNGTRSYGFNVRCVRVRQ